MPDDPEAEQAAKKEDLTLGKNRSSASGFTNVLVQAKGESTLRPVMSAPRGFGRMPPGITRAYTSAGHAALMIALHDKA